MNKWRVQKCRCSREKFKGCGNWVAIRPDGSVYSYATTLQRAWQDAQDRATKGQEPTREQKLEAVGNFIAAINAETRERQERAAKFARYVAANAHGSQSDYVLASARRY